MTLRYVRLLCIWFPVFINSLVYSASVNQLPILILDDPCKEFIPDTTMLRMEDSTGMLDFNQVRIKLSDFKKNTQSTINLGITASAIWCVFRIKNETSKNWYIDIGEPYIDNIDLYLIDKNGQFEHISTGLFKEYKQRTVKTNHYLIPLNLNTYEEKTLFIRAASTTILKLPIIIATIQTHYEENHKKDFIFGIYFGLILALSIYNFFVFISIRDITYLYYVFYINFLGALVAWLRGYSPEFLSFVSPWVNHGNIYAALTFMSLILFTNTFLNLKKYYPKLMFIGYIFLIVNLFSLLANIIGNFRLGFYIIMASVYINLPYVTLFGYYTYRKGLKSAAFYLLGFGIFTLGDFIFILNEIGILSQSNFTHYSLMIGSSLEAMILSFALANKLNSFKKEKELSQLNAIAQAGKFSKDLIDTQEAERKRIASELHDSVGQSLSLIKNKINLIISGNKKEQSLQELNELVTETIQEVRGISYGLRPFQLDILGLTQSIRSLVEDVDETNTTDFSITIENVDGIFSKEAEINIYRIIQEGLNNIIKHAKATQAAIDIRVIESSVEIYIRDNGIGTGKIKGDAKGLGLIGIKERVIILNGFFSITDNEPKGTLLNIRIPVSNIYIKNNITVNIG